MTKTQHTQGKWTVTPLGYHQGYELKVDGFLPTVTNGEHEANAKLIAASPLLYEYAAKQAESGCKIAQSMLASLHLTK